MVAAVTFGLWNGIWFGIHGAAFPGVKWISGWSVLTHLYVWSDYRFPRPIASVLLANTFLSPFMIAIGAWFTSRLSLHTLLPVGAKIRRRRDLNQINKRPKRLAGDARSRPDS